MHFGFRAILVGLAVGLSLMPSAEVMAGSAPAIGSTKVWGDRPGAPTIMEGYPIGNGRLGALVAGGVESDRMPLCEDSVWAGGPFDYDNPEALSALPAARQLIFEGKLAEANALIQKRFVCRWGPEIMEHFGNFQTLGYLDLTFPRLKGAEVTDYRRELDLARAVVTVKFRAGGVVYTREVFASHPARAIVVRLSASVPGSIDVEATLGRPDKPETGMAATSGDKLTAPVAVTADAEGSLLMSGRLYNNKEQTGLRIVARGRVLNEGGVREAAGDRVRVTGADAVTLLIAGATDYRGVDPLARTSEQLSAAAVRAVPELRREHEADYARLFGRNTLYLGATRDEVPTERRLIDVANGGTDPDLAALYLHFGRYLLISSSRPGDLAANLQGLWAETIRTPWHGDYHTNINVQMNYWPAEAANLAECVEPLVDLVERMVEPGTRTVKTHYGMRGWTVHTIHNIWGFTSPGHNPAWGAFPMGGPWMCQHLWESYAFSGDVAFLRRVWPVLKGSGEFVLDWLVVDPASGKLVSGPSNSPENKFKLPDGKTASFTMGPSMDQQIVWDLLTNLIEAARVLQIDDEFTRRVADARAKLKWTGIASDGRVMEWSHELTEVDPRHRHISHLFGLYPGSQFNSVETPEYLVAARKTLDVRGDEGTGWSLAWKANFWARLRDGDRAEKLLRQLLRPTRGANTNYSRGGGTYPNMFCAHPPMQIDGNFGGAAAVLEMLVQSHLKQDGRRLIDLLPALPSAWPEGELRGVRVRGGAEVDVTWRGGRVVTVNVRASQPGTWAVRAADRRTFVTLEAGSAVTLDAGLLPVVRGAR